jgi:5'-methylthioadenosine phosphorylase
MKPIGIIGGSGFYELLEKPRMFIHDNMYGRSSEIYEGTIEGIKVYFLPRHGPDHKIIVPRIPYRANMMAFKELGVQKIFATNSVGCLNPDIELGDLVIPDDYFDMTRRYPRSMYDDVTDAYHVDMSPAYCPEIRRSLIDAANQVKPGHVHDKAKIVVDEGLRFNTQFENRVFRSWGADLIGMTTLPEAIFARELSICYAHICLPNNYCIDVEIDASEFPVLLKQGVKDFKETLKIAIKNVDDEVDCPCKHALDYAILSK